MTREEAIERLKQNKAAAKFYAGMVQNTNAIENELKDIEAIDMAIEALSERTGEWIYSTKQLEIVPMWECSCCRIRAAKKFNFCPHCGAKMDGERSE